MDLLEMFHHGKLILPEKEADFGEIAWSNHPTFKGVELKHIITAKDTEGKFSYHWCGLRLAAVSGTIFMKPRRKRMR